MRFKIIFELVDSKHLNKKIKKQLLLLKTCITVFDMNTT